MIPVKNRNKQINSRTSVKTIDMLHAPLPLPDIGLVGVPFDSGLRGTYEDGMSYLRGTGSFDDPYALFSRSAGKHETLLSLRWSTGPDGASESDAAVLLKGVQKSL
jgi:hypothetical protein